MNRNTLLSFLAGAAVVCMMAAGTGVVRIHADHFTGGAAMDEVGATTTINNRGISVVGGEGFGTVLIPGGAGFAQSESGELIHQVSMSAQAGGIRWDNYDSGYMCYLVFNGEELFVAIVHMESGRIVLRQALVSNPAIGKVEV